MRYILIQIVFLLFVSTSIHALPTAPLQQTGQTSCWDSSGSQIRCTNTGQDGGVRAGVVWPSPRFTSNADQTVSDNLTGLTWSKDANSADVKTWQQALDYINSLNHQNWLGHSDWRLPNINELQSLINRQQSDVATWLNSQGFSNVQANYYWSGSTIANTTYGAWVVHMSYGSVAGVSKTYGNGYLWPVRSGQSGSFGSLDISKTGQTGCWNVSGAPINCTDTGQDGDLQMGAAWPSPRFTSNADLTVSDNLTGLAWSKDARPGWKNLTWQQALDYIDSLNSQNWLGHSDWRLPNVNELQNLINRQQSDVAAWLNSQGFSNVMPALNYWSGSTYARNTGSTWSVGMEAGVVVDDDKVGLGYVWPVRSGQLSAIGSLDILKTGAGSGSGLVTASSGNITWSGSAGFENYPIGSVVTLTAASNSGSVFFGGWSGCDSVNGTVCNVTIKGVQQVMANFSNLLVTFVVPATSMTLTVPITTFTALSGAAVTGYCLNETNNSGSCAWVANAPTSYTFTTDGVKTLYAFAKDATGEISTSVSATVTVSTIPVVTAFTVPATSTTLTVPITTFTAMSGAAVTGYCLNETNNSGSCAWVANAPTSYTFTTDGVKTLYAFAKDATGKISTSVSATVTVSTIPVVTTFTVPATSTTLTVPITTFTALSGAAVTGYCLNETNNSTSCAWSANAPTSYTFTANGVKTLYAFAKDATGKISTSASATVTISTIPVVTAFTVPATSTTLTVPITTFTALSGAAVTGYCLNETNNITSCTWAANAPTSYTFTTNGIKTLYAFAKDATGKISTSVSATVTVDTIPVITAFSMPATSTTLTVPITAFTATDNIAVTGYLITETATPPLTTAPGWKATAPISYTFATSGNKTLYAWAKDAIGNVSTPATATILVDTTKPTVKTFALQTPYNNLTVPVSSFTATDDLGVGGYLITTTATVPLATDPAWSATAQTSVTFPPTTVSGTYTRYAWVKDNAGNISSSLSASVNIDLAIPIVTAFSMVPYINGLTVPVKQFTASDIFGGVTGYCLTEVNDSSGCNWSATAPVSYTFSSIGSKTLYAWAKDAAGNLSEPATVTLDLCAVTAASDANGNITLPGTSYYYCSQNRLYKISPKPGYRIADLKVDGLTVGKVSSYLFTSMATPGNHTIAATFELDPFANWHQVAPGYLHTIAVRSDGTMWGWGDNSGYQLGDGTTNTRHNPIRVTAYTDWQTAAAGPYHSLGSRTNGNLYGWGDNTSGQLGESDSPLPVLIDSSAYWQELFAAGTTLSSSYSLARKSDGSFKQLGASPSGSITASNTIDWVTLAAGTSHTAAIRADGTIWSWGSNSKGQLGDNSKTSRNTPVLTGSANNWVQVAAGKAHTVGLQANGTLWTWGDNSWGQLGTDRIPNALATPLQIGSGQSWKGIAAGDYHTLALRADGTIWAFGNNTHGQLGDGSNATVNLPVQVGTDSDWKSIVAHGDLSFGIKNNNTLHAWGANDKGQLGDTTTVDKFSPVLVATNTNSFVITATAGNGGNISPSGITTNPVGTSKTFSIASLVGWKISDVKVDGVSVGAVTSYTFNNIIDSHAIVALFSPDNSHTYTITASTNVGASISPNGTVNVAGGNSQVFSIAPQSNYTISDVIVDGVSQGSLGTYTFSNVSSSHLIQAVATLIDNTAPTGSISINGGAAYTTATAVNITLSATDSGSGISKMRFSVDNVTWTAWENYATRKGYTLASGNGTKNLYVQYRDAAGNTSIPYHASIILDTLPPTGSVILNGGAAITNSATVTATITATDSGGTVAQMQFSWDNTSWQAWQTYAASTNLTLPASGFNTLCGRFKDAAGNISSVENTSIAYNQLMALTLTVSGNGTVNSVPSGFSCGTGPCSADYAIGTQIKLIATAGADSTFSVWSGSCNGNGDCNLTMDSAKLVTATFLAAPKVKVGVKPFSTIQAAYNDSVTTIDKSVIMLLEGNLAGAFTADRKIVVTLEGGYDAAFGKVDSETVIQSPLVIKSGTVVINGIVIQ